MDNLNLPNNVHSSLDGDKGNLHADFSQAKMNIFSTTHHQRYTELSFIEAIIIIIIYLNDICTMIAVYS